MVNEFLGKAWKNLEAARICFENGLYDASASRAYFAAFQAAIAALLDKGERHGKFDHKWVQATFSEKLIKRRKMFPGRFRAYLIEMQARRNAADYSSESISKKNAAELLRRAVEIVEEIGKEVTT
jgi:uncharacterized protein (UPF0332 family)